MNGLSWLLYLVDVFDEVDTVAGFLTIVGTGAAIIAMFVKSFIPEGSKNEFEAASRAMKYSLTVAIVFGILSALVPSKRTMYLIMGSEMSEEVLTSETAMKVYEVVNQALDEYLGHEAGGDNDG